MTDRGRGGEFGIIRRYFAPLAQDVPGAFDLMDDAGLIVPLKGHELVVNTDMIVGGVHMLDDAAPQDVAYKALAVNISDLIAKGAEPSVYLLSIALPGTPEPVWLEGLREGFLEAQSAFGCRLLGGDTVKTPGPVVLSVTAAGFVREGGMVHRSGAREGDAVYVTGTIGDGALGLILLQASEPPQLSEDQSGFLKSRYWRPCPRMAAIALVRAYANAAMDISDGIAGDFAKLCGASNTGGVIRAADVPLSHAAAAWLKQEPGRLNDILSGGDDYEVLLCVPPAKTEKLEKDCAGARLQITRIGEIVPRGEGVKVLDEDGAELKLERLAYDHF